MAINPINNLIDPAAASLYAVLKEPKFFDSIAEFSNPVDMFSLAQSAKGMFDISVRNFDVLASKEIEMMTEELNRRGSHKSVASQLTKIAEVSDRVYRSKKWSFRAIILSTNSSAVYALAQLPVDERNHLLSSLALRKPAKDMIKMTASISNNV